MPLVLVSFSQLDTSQRHLGRETFERVPLSGWPASKSVRTFSCILTDGGGLWSVTLLGRGSWVVLKSRRNES